MLNKKTFRDNIKKINLEFKDNNFDKEDSIIISKLIKTEMYQKANIILLYYPLKNEVNVKKLIDYSININKRVALPITYKDKIEFNLIDENWENNLISGKYNILEPNKKEIIMNFEPNSLIIVPALAYGKNKSRIGHGGGYYDKYLQMNPYLIKVGLARQHLLFDTVPMEKNDIYLDYIITSI